MVRKALIATNGLLACRIMRTCRRLGIETVALYTNDDQAARHVNLADEAIYIGKDVENYGDMQTILDAMQRTGADGVHPGAGRFAHEPGFAYFMKGAGFTFIGPSPECIEIVDDQSMMRHFLYDIPLASETSMRFVRQLEVQIVSDRHGACFALGDREVMLEYDNRTFLIEAPIPALHTDLRHTCQRMAVRIAQQLGYNNIGTVRLLIDEQDNIYFDKMFTHLTLTGAVTEALYALDLVEWQFEIAERVPLAALMPNGLTEAQLFNHPAQSATQAIVWAEDPRENYNIDADTLLYWQTPSDAAFELAVEAHELLNLILQRPLASVVGAARHRRGALQKLSYALAELALLGVPNNIPLLRQIARHPTYRPGSITETLVDESSERLVNDTDARMLALSAAAISIADRMMLQGAKQPLRLRLDEGGQTHDLILTRAETVQFHVVLGDKFYDIQLVEQSDAQLTLISNGHRQSVTVARSEHNDLWVHTRSNYYRITWQRLTTAQQSSAGQVG